MKTTILLSNQRSGTTFFDNTVGGMCGLMGQGGEPLRLKFFEKHQASHLVKKCDEKILLNDNTVRLPMEKEYCMSLSAKFFDELCDCSPRPILNFQYDQLKNNPKYIQGTKSKIILLIRKNNWMRSVSQYILKKKKILGLPAHFAENLEKKVAIKIDIKLVEKKAALANKRTLKFKDAFKNQTNLKIIYYEDICEPSHWTAEFIDELEEFLGVNFTNKDYRCPWKKSAEQYEYINKNEVFNEKLIEKYYIT